MEANFDVHLPKGNLNGPEATLLPNHSGWKVSQSCGAHYRRSVANPYINASRSRHSWNLRTK